MSGPRRSLRGKPGQAALHAGPADDAAQPRTEGVVSGLDLLRASDAAVELRHVPRQPQQVELEVARRPVPLPRLQPLQRFHEQVVEGTVALPLRAEGVHKLRADHGAAQLLQVLAHGGEALQRLHPRDDVQVPSPRQHEAAADQRLQVPGHPAPGAAHALRRGPDYAQVGGEEGHHPVGLAQRDVLEHDGLCLVEAGPVRHRPHSHEAEARIGCLSPAVLPGDAEHPMYRPSGKLHHRRAVPSPPLLHAPGEDQGVSLQALS